MFVVVTLQVLYKLKTSKVFDESRCRQRKSNESDSGANVSSTSSSAAAAADDDVDFPFAITQMYLCVDSRLLCIAGVSHVVVFNFSKLEMTFECPVGWRSIISTSSFCLFGFYRFFSFQLSLSVKFLSACLQSYPKTVQKETHPETLI